MSKRPAIESLESRQLLSGGPFGQNSLDQVESAVVIGSSVALHASAVSSTARTAQNSPLPWSTLVDLVTGPTATPVVPAVRPMMVAFRSLGGAGGPVHVPPTVHTSDHSDEPDAAGDHNSTSLEPGEGAKTTQIPAPQAVHEASDQGAGSESTLPVCNLGPVFDACFADEARALSLEEVMNFEPEAVAGPSELDLLVAVAGMAATVGFAADESEKRPGPAGQPRRQSGRPDAG